MLHDWTLYSLSLHALFLLVAEGFDGVEVGGFPGGVDAEDQADGAGADEGEQHPEHADAGRDEEVNGQGKSGAEEDADDAADRAEHDGFKGELQQDGLFGCADRFSDADLASALGDGDEHDVHHADAADDEADGGEAEHEQEE